MEINSRTETLEYTFSGVDTRYAVPHYQRNYSWTYDHRAQLWSDILTAFNSSSEYFLGSIVLNRESLDDEGHLEIVDGQQRLTTLTTLFASIRDISNSFINNPSNVAFRAIDSSNLPSRERAERAKILSNNLIVRLGAHDNFYLKLNDKDQGRFLADVQQLNEGLLTKEGQKSYKAEPRVIKSKKFFSRKIVETFVSETDGFVALEKFTLFCMTKLLLLRISVESDTDAYLLFETLNDRGLDLSISDLVKNRLLLSCNGDNERKDRTLKGWNELIEKLGKSRFQPQDFLRFYWCAFHTSCSKKELYKKIKEKINEVCAEALLREWNDAADYFCEITDKDLTYPSSSVLPHSPESEYVELKTLGYSVYLPLFLKLNRERPHLIEKIAPVCLSYLFRIISVGRFSNGRAEKRFNEAISHLSQGSEDEAIIACFEQDEESSDDRFKTRLQTMRFDDNKLAKYFLAKIHLHDLGSGHALNSGVHLEHILPQASSSWPWFRCGEKERDDWVYSIGNMTLLEDIINKQLQTKPFIEKVQRFKQRTSEEEKERTAIPMSYQIHEQYCNGSTKWDRYWINRRAEDFSNKALSVWPLNLQIPQANAGDPATYEVDDTRNWEVDNSEKI